MGLINVLYVCVYSMQGMHAWKILWSIVMIILLSCLCVIIKYNDYFIPYITNNGVNLELVSGFMH